MSANIDRTICLRYSKILLVGQKGVEWGKVVMYKMTHGHPVVQIIKEQVSYRLTG